MAEQAGTPKDVVNMTADAHYAATQAMSRVLAWDWVRVHASKEASEVMGALERLGAALKAAPAKIEPPSAEGWEWDAFAHRWVQKDPKTGPAVQWNRTTGA